MCSNIILRGKLVKNADYFRLFAGHG